MAKKNNIGRRPSGTPNTGRRSGGVSGPVVEGDDTLVDIVEVRDQGYEFFERNRNAIIYGALGLIALVAGILIYQTFIKRPAERNAAEQMQQAQVQFERDSFALALTNPGQGYPGFLDIIDEYGGTRAGNLANYYAGVSYLNLGKYEAALDYLNSFDADGDLLPAMKYGTTGDALGELGRNEEAIEAYRQAVDEADENYIVGGYFQNKLAQLLRIEGQTAEALEAFRKLKADYGQSPEAAQADKYIGMLE